MCAMNDGRCSPWVMCSCSVASGNQIRDKYKPNRPLRSLGSSQLEIPRVHTKQGESAFSYYAARSWNQLPEEIRCAKTLATFKSSLKTHLFSCAFVE